MKIKRYILIVIKKAQLSQFFLPLLAICCFIVLALVYIFYNPKPQAVETSSQSQAHVALIFEDAGMDEQEVQKLLEIDPPFNVAIMPFLPFSNKIALMCSQKKKEALIHLSMEPEDQNTIWLASRSIMNNTPDDEIERIFKDAMANIPQSRGFSIHFGTLVCTNDRIVEKLCNLAKENNMIIVDSTASAKSLFPRIGKQKGVDVISHDVIVDTKNELKSIQDRFRLLFNIAKKKGFAVGIGHLGQDGGLTTIEAFKEAVKDAQRENIKFVFVSDIVKFIKQND
ncbi:divergent polysaccharide deacetylase family protein [Caldicellulosiruptor naganoensis]|uniref:Divergent polysaccharide deacetylase family protein n=1 Tax=Caldicellulosiruptor naganoensis TaxID=29324 RepID=A0ABY7BJZ0_9FIRM|nr:divergent polysaccharide deacetylase family protein [Caldicellulosiruptor naganoensis]WAM31351.1 divergent polysaccharide deacetylase family protein [Caldicellulosiruptor naganoensis]